MALDNNTPSGIPDPAPFDTVNPSAPVLLAEFVLASMVDRKKKADFGIVPGDDNALFIAALTDAVGKIKDLQVRLDESEKRNTIDALTGAKNRAGFNADLWRALKEESRLAFNQTGEHESGVVLMMGDANRFKSINDRLGHPAGDEALNILTQTLYKMVRPGDTVARTGGDEFSLILRHTTTTQAAEHIRAIQAATKNLTLNWTGVEAQFGITFVAHDCDLTLSPDENYKIADKKLTDVKEAERRALVAPTPANQSAQPASPAATGPAPR